MKRKNKKTADYIPAIFVFILAVTASLLIFSAFVQKSIEINSQKTMKNNVSRQSEHILTILEIHYSYLNSMADEIGNAEELLSQKNLDMLVSLRENTDLERTALIEPDGTAHYDNGVVKNVSKRRYFKEGMQGEETLSDPLESSVDQETRVVLGVPVYKNGEVTGILGGSYNVTALSRMLFNDVFDGIGYSLIVTRDGEIIAYDGDSAYHKITYGDNFFEFYQEKTLLGDTVLKNVQSDFGTGNDGLIKMRNGSNHRSDQYLAYTKLGRNDWMICYVIPVSAAQKPYSFMKSYELYLLIGFTVLVCLLLLYIIRKNNDKNQQLVHEANTDALTGICNKKTTEEKINTALEQNPGICHTFVILDVDKFKEVNDVYGHMAGDEVLRQLGKLLQNHFREQDVVGRIGGDEFVVFMNETERKEDAIFIVGKLIQKVQQLKLECLDGKSITISVGVAFAPEAGSEYQELYKHADMALYETKQSGKNGYHIYNACVNEIK